MDQQTTQGCKSDSSTSSWCSRVTSPRGDGQQQNDHYGFLANLESLGDRPEFHVDPNLTEHSTPATRALALYEQINTHAFQDIFSIGQPHGFYRSSPSAYGHMASALHELQPHGSSFVDPNNKSISLSLFTNFHHWKIISAVLQYAGSGFSNDTRIILPSALWCFSCYSRFAQYEEWFATPGSHYALLQPRSDVTEVPPKAFYTD